MDHQINASVDRYGSVDRWIGKLISGREELLDESGWVTSLSVSPGKEFPVENMAVMA